MDKEAREKLVQDLKGIGGANTNLLAWIYLYDDLN